MHRVSKCEDLMQLEKGIPINEFLDEAPQRNKPMEFRVEIYTIYIC